MRETSRKKRTLTWLTGGFFGFAILLSVGLITFTIVFFFSRVDGPSMMTVLNAYHHTEGNTDAVIVNRHVRASRGDIIVVRFYNDGRPSNTAGWHQSENGFYRYYIKRLIAVGGDTLNLGRYWPQGANQWHYVLELNGEPLIEEYLDSFWGANLGRDSGFDRLWNMINNPTQRQLSPFSQFIRECPINPERFTIHIDEGYIFYIGDNRRQSHDSRTFGPQRANLIVGVAVDIVRNNQSLPMYFLDWVWHIVSFRWAWG